MTAQGHIWLDHEKKYEWHSLFCCPSGVSHHLRLIVHSCISFIFSHSTEFILPFTFRAKVFCHYLESESASFYFLSQPLLLVWHSFTLTSKLHHPIILLCEFNQFNPTAISQLVHNQLWKFGSMGFAQPRRNFALNGQVTAAEEMPWRLI